jgi:hypothetical protein
MRSELFGENLEAGTQDRFALQNPDVMLVRSFSTTSRSALRAPPAAVLGR